MVGYAPAEARHRPQPGSGVGSRWRARWSRQRVVIVAVAVLGICVLLYPAAASWFSDRKHATEVNGYVSQVQAMDPERTRAALAQAREYNRSLPGGPLRDPWTLDATGRNTAIGEGKEAYYATLNQQAGQSGDDEGPGGVMARLRIPQIGADLPVFHGTDEQTLTRGVGHLYGSGLPVGGAGTHSVLTAHSGLATSTLFTDLHRLEDGDVFTVQVMDELLHYRVDQIITVEPDETEALRQVPGHDYLTLITCTPIGVNTHRLLVRAERVDPPAADDGGVVTLASDTTDPGFPWWALGMAGGAAAAVVVTRPRRGRAIFGA